MPNRTKNLTDVSVRSLPEGLHFDSKIKSFGIRVGKNRKTWIAIVGKNRTKVTLGHYPALSLQEARKKAQLTLSLPVPKKTPPFPEAVQSFLALDRWRPGSKKVLASSLKHFTWTRPLDKITYEDVERALEAIKSPSARHHALKDIRTFFNWCVPRYLTSSPINGLKSTNQPSRSRVLSDQELRAVWNAAGQMSRPGIIIKLLILTGQRKSEISGLRWEWINTGVVELPAWITKNNRVHTFPLGNLAQELIGTPKGMGYLFPARGNASAFKGWSATKTRLDKLSGVTNWTLHDLRRTFATGLAQLGTPIHVTEKILNHVSGVTGGLTGVYQRFEYWDEQIVAVQKWQERIQSICHGAH